MQLIISGEKQEVRDGITIEQLIQEKNIEYPDYVSVSVNTKFPERKDYGSYVLKDGDEVEFLYFMGGGK